MKQMSGVCLIPLIYISTSKVNKPSKKIPGLFSIVAVSYLILILIPTKPLIPWLGAYT